jgi:hypothetical protein
LRVDIVADPHCRFLGLLRIFHCLHTVVVGHVVGEACESGRDLGKGSETFVGTDQCAKNNIVVFGMQGLHQIADDTLIETDEVQRVAIEGQIVEHRVDGPVRRVRDVGLRTRSRLGFLDSFGVLHCRPGNAGDIRIRLRSLRPIVSRRGHPEYFGTLLCFLGRGDRGSRSWFRLTRGGILAAGCR